MVEAPNPLGVHPTSMPYVYTVFQHLDIRGCIDKNFRKNISSKIKFEVWKL
jgi:hypothetical protein